MSDKNKPPLPADPHSARLLKELQSLNLHFISVLCGSPDPLHHDHRAQELNARLCRLSSDEQHKLASCPYALFDLDLSNDRHWRSLLHNVQTENETGDAQASHFVLASLCYAQRLAQENPDLGRLLLNMNTSVCHLLQDATIGQLMDVAIGGDVLLQTRLSDDPNFWPDLVNFVHEGTPEQYLAAQTCALQLVAAGRA